MNINEFKASFRGIQNMGYVKSLRMGPTGIGMTLETLLGIYDFDIHYSIFIWNNNTRTLFKEYIFIS